MMSTCCSKHVEAWNKYIKKECVKLVINQSEEVSVFVVISRCILLRMRNILDNIVEKKHKIYFPELFPQNLALHNIMWKKYCGAEQATGNNMAHVLWIMDNWSYKHTHTHTLRIRNTDFPLQQWLNESASMLRYTYFARLIPFRVLTAQN
jgi:hypothetical protein